MRAGPVAFVLVLAAVAGASAAGCAPPEPYVRYDGSHYGRKPKPIDDMEVLRGGPPAPPARYQDLGTVVVTCPSHAQGAPLGMTHAVGGCNYLWAVRQASQRAATVGADGIHSIETATNSAGATVSLRASAFVRLPKLVSTAPPAPPPPKTAEPTVSQRLRQLEELKKEDLITPEEYAKKRAEILDEI